MRVVFGILCRIRDIYFHFKIKTMVTSAAAPFACCYWTQSRGDTTSCALLTDASADQPQTKIVQPWLINGVFPDGYDAGQMYRLLVR